MFNGSNDSKQFYSYKYPKTTTNHKQPKLQSTEPSLSIDVVPKLDDNLIGNKLSNFNKCIFTEDFINKTFKHHSNNSHKIKSKANYDDNKNVSLTYRRPQNIIHETVGFQNKSNIKNMPESN